MATWLEIKDRIDAMSDEEKHEDAYFAESYDDDSEINPVEICVATEDLANPYGEVVIRKGEHYLC